MLQPVWMPWVCMVSPSSRRAPSVWFQAAHRSAHVHLPHLLWSRTAWSYAVSYAGQARFEGEAYGIRFEIRGKEGLVGRWTMDNIRGARVRLSEVSIAAMHAERSEREMEVPLLLPPTLFPFSRPPHDDVTQRLGF